MLRRRSGESDRDGTGAWLIAGLGNPGPEYERTRHNVGFRVVELLADSAGARFKRGKHSALVAETRLAGERVVLVKPQTYMNESGRAVGPLAKYYKVPPALVVAVHDEIDIGFGELRLKIGGGTAGHNGLRSLVSALGTQDFVRVRVGVGRPPGRKDPVDYVLEPFARNEQQEVEILIREAADAVEMILSDGAERAQNAINTRG